MFLGTKVGASRNSAGTIAIDKCNAFFYCLSGLSNTSFPKTTYQWEIRLLANITPIHFFSLLLFSQRLLHKFMCALTVDR